MKIWNRNKKVYLEFFIIRVLSHVFNDPSPVEFLKEKDGLLLGHLSSEVWILLQTFLQPVYSIRRTETVLVGSHVLLVFLQRHTTPEIPN